MDLGRKSAQQNHYSWKDIEILPRCSCDKLNFDFAPSVYESETYRNERKKARLQVVKKAAKKHMHAHQARLQQMKSETITLGVYKQPSVTEICACMQTWLNNMEPVTSH